MTVRSRLANWGHRPYWPLVVRLVVLVLSAVVVVGLWFVWHAPGLDRPNADFAGGVRFGMSDAPADTRVFFYIAPWDDQRDHVVRLMLGQSSTKTADPVLFRLEVNGFLRPSRRPCPAAATEHTCTSGDTPVPTGTVREFEDGNTGATVITGSFDPGARSYIEFSPVSLGAARNGPYRSFYSEIGMVDDDAAGWGYPKRGIEVEVSSGVGSDQARYDSFFPTQPYRLYPDGWVWSIPSPGAPLGVQLVDAEAEDRLRSRSEVAGLMMGVFLALFVQTAYELLQHLKELIALVKAPNRPDHSTS